MYYDYHAVAKKRIREGHLIAARRMDAWGGIKKPLVLFFDDHRPMPIREERIPEYAELISAIESERGEKGEMGEEGEKGKRRGARRARKKEAVKKGTFHSPL